MKDLAKLTVWECVLVGANIGIIVSTLMLIFTLSGIITDLILGPDERIKVAVRDVPYQPEQPAKEAEG
jgi:hypothetical protein